LYADAPVAFASPATWPGALTAVGPRVEPCRGPGGREGRRTRAAAYAELFGCRPSACFPYTDFGYAEDERFLIDVFVYTLATDTRDIAVAVTNGMSDYPMVDADDPTQYARRELIQYLPACTPAHARRLHAMAWVPHFDGLLLDTHHTMAWHEAAVQGTPWTNAFFLLPLVRSHREFTFEVEGDPVSLLWHIPISDAEREFKRKNGPGALIERMDAVKLPWVFDEQNRPPLVE
jgi:hypothetical protein